MKKYYSIIQAQTRPWLEIFTDFYEMGILNERGLVEFQREKDKADAINFILEQIDEHGNPDWEVMFDYNCYDHIPTLHVILLSNIGTHIFRWHDSKWHDFNESCMEGQKVFDKMNHYFDGMPLIDLELFETVVFTNEKYEREAKPNGCSDICVIEKSEVSNYISYIVELEAVIGGTIDREEIWFWVNYHDRQYGFSHMTIEDEMDLCRNYINNEEKERFLNHSK